MDDDRSVDELIEIADEIPDRLGLASGMADLRGTARGEHVTAVVDVRGKLVRLDIADQALELGPERLAAEIARLSTEAGQAALRDGLRAIRAGCGPSIADAIEGHLGLEEPAPSTSDSGPAEGAAPAARRPQPGGDEDEYFTLKPVG
jgi:hypothetical protein